ncbi:hypothetical protein BDV95DRAFT_314140 [Massariosphaeria phaeospora]|uniref:Uncharacterized protein n=1 Tax=Massariosphaeria phaeospora TaxID=100035 RepID=A0A7C8IIT6_9PLEO|nr:hypothetical protein BDV95DRAFT_314140 [Massariosphaeria phaeospora]
MCKCHGRSSARSPGTFLSLETTLLHYEAWEHAVIFLLPAMPIGAFSPTSGYPPSSPSSSNTPLSTIQGSPFSASLLYPRNPRLRKSCIPMSNQTIKAARHKRATRVFIRLCLQLVPVAVRGRVQGHMSIPELRFGDTRVAGASCRRLWGRGCC